MQVTEESDDDGQRRTLAQLRKRAMDRLEREAVEISGMSPDETRELAHELRTHQIELELQNEELRRAQAELGESHDRYSDLYDFAPVGYVTISQEGLILEANLTVAEILGVERGALVKSPISAFIIADDEDIFYQHRRTIIKSGQRDTCRLRMVRRDREPLWVEMETILIEAVDEGPRLRTVIIDITERQQLEAARQALERGLLHAQKLESLGVLAGGIAHDFNNLLTTILGNANLALYKLPPTSPVLDNLQSIESASRRAAELANQMLAYSGKGQFVIEPIDIAELLAEMAHLLEATISKKAVLQCNSAEDLPSFAGDATQIRQVIVNLTTNASEAIGDRDGVIVLSTGARACDRAYLDDVTQALRTGLDEPLSEGVYVYLEVADTGCGMDAQTIERIFDPFFTTKATGRGLGMSAVLGILRGHRGALKIHSELGKGTTCRVLFSAMAPTEDGLADRRSHETEATHWRGSGTVLIADDEEQVLSVVRQMLEHIGFCVLTAPNGRGALEVFREHADEIVCVLLDLTMPHMDGVEAFREISQLDPGVKVVLCSGYHEQDVIQRFSGEGLAGFIQKPFSVAGLRAALGEIIYDVPNEG